MKQISLKITCLLLIGKMVSAQTTFNADNSLISYLGRIDFSNTVSPTYIYPGVQLSAKFHGTAISAIINDYGDGTIVNGNFYKVFIDGDIVTEQLLVANGEQTYLLASGLTVGEHTVKIMKITEGASGKSSFKGFVVEGGNELLISNPQNITKRIEFIGDSWTCGFGNLSQFTSGQASMVNSNYVAENEDNYYAWGPIASRALGAYYHVTATSGRGLYRNNTGSLNNTIPLNYDNVFEDDASVQYDHGFAPDVIVIHLGTNDLALEENGQQFKLDDEAFKQTYIAFINKLLTLHPCANVVICFGNSKSDSWPTWTKQLTRLRNIANDVVTKYVDGNVTTLELPYTAEKWTGNPADDCGYGDAWHPSKCSHEEMAVKLVQKVNAMNVQWGNTGCIPSSQNEMIEKTAVSVYPNPVTNQLFIEHSNANENWVICNALGEMVKNINYNGVNGVDVSGLKSGFYLIKPAAANSVESIKFVKR